MTTVDERARQRAFGLTSQALGRELTDAEKALIEKALADYLQAHKTLQ